MVLATKHENYSKNQRKSSQNSIGISKLSELRKWSQSEDCCSYLLMRIVAFRVNNKGKKQEKELMNLDFEQSY